MDKALDGAPLLSALFTIRAQHLLLSDAVEGASFASGLLIGSDVQAGLALADRHEKIAVVGRTDLCQLYAKAITHAGYHSDVIDGDKAFLAGIGSITSNFETGNDR